MDSLLHLIGGLTVMACCSLMVAGGIIYVVLRQIQRERRVRTSYRMRLAEYRRAVNAAANSR
jgi:hypothetical protein